MGVLTKEWRQCSHTRESTLVEVKQTSRGGQSGSQHEFSQNRHEEALGALVSILP